MDYKTALKEAIDGKKVRVVEWHPGLYMVFSASFKYDNGSAINLFRWDQAKWEFLEEKKEVEIAYHAHECDGIIHLSILDSEIFKDREIASHYSRVYPQ